MAFAQTHVNTFKFFPEVRSSPSHSSSPLGWCGVNSSLILIARGERRRREIRFLTEPYAAAGKPESCAMNKSARLPSVLYHPLFSIPHLSIYSAFMISSTFPSLTSFHSSFLNLCLFLSTPISSSPYPNLSLSPSVFKGLLSCFSKKSWKK